MSNEYFEPGSIPAPNSPGTSAVMRGEFNNIALGFDKLPPLTGNANKFIVVNSTANGLSSVDLNYLELVTLDGSQQLTNKTIPYDQNTFPGFGTVVTFDVGLQFNNVVQLVDDQLLPALDGGNLYNLNADALGIVGVDHGGTGAANVAGAQTNLGINLKANIISPSLQGVPQAPTPSQGDSSDRIATTRFVTDTLTTVGAVTLGSATPLADSGLGSAGTSPTFASREDHSHPSDTSRAPIASPNFTGTPTAPTAANGTNTSQLATTAFVLANAGAGAIDIGDVTGLQAELDLKAPLASPVLTGNPQAPTPTQGDNDTSIATTAFVATALGSFAPLASPVLTGDPKAPTPLTSDNDTSIATTAFVKAAIAAQPSSGMQPSNSLPVMAGTASAGVGVEGSRYDHRHPTDTTRAPLASPLFTGDPRAPTPTQGDNDTSIATTAFVTTAVLAVSGGGASPSAATPLMAGVAAVGTDPGFSRGDHRHPTDTTRAPLASPSFTGTPATATSPVTADNSTKLATTAFVRNAINSFAPAAVSPSAATPLMAGTAAVGTDAGFSRGDHRHPTDTSRFAVAGGTISGAVTTTGLLTTSAAVRMNNGQSIAFWNGATEYGSIIGNTNGISIFAVGGSIQEFQFNKTAGIGYSPGGWLTFSDRRLKDDIQGISNPLDRLALITGCTYNRKDMAGMRRAGVIAQDVKLAIPEGVTIPDEETGIMAVDPMAIIALLVESVKALEMQVAELKGKR